jgi:cell division septation protein DedD
MKKIIEKVELSCNWIKRFPTKTSIHIFLLGLMTLFVTAYAAEDNWVYVSEREDDLWFVNTDSIMCWENICKASVKMQPLAEKYEYTTEANEYNCKEVKYKTLRKTTYDSNGNITRTITPEGQGWNYIVPESISKELYDFVCKKAPNHKEQLNTDEKDEEQLTGEKLARNYEVERVEDSAKQVQLQDSVTTEDVETQGATVEDKKDTSLQPQKPSDVIFTVQVGAFKNTSYAQTLMVWLKEKGYSAYIILSGSKEGGKLYKVCIGKFIEREKAKTLSEKIKNSEGLQTFVASLQP